MNQNLHSTDIKSEEQSKIRFFSQNKHNCIVNFISQLGHHKSNGTPWRFDPEARRQRMSFYQKYVKQALYTWDFYLDW